MYQITEWQIYSRSTDYSDGCLKWQKEYFARRCRRMGFAWRQPPGRMPTPAPQPRGLRVGPLSSWFPADSLQRHPESRDCLKRIGAQQGLLCSVPFPVRHLGEDLLSSFHWGGVGKIRWVSRSVCIEMPFGAESRGFFLFLSRKGSVYLDLCVYMWFSGRKWRGTKECLDEGERREWKRWLETQHLKN